MTRGKAIPTSNRIMGNYMSNSPGFRPNAGAQRLEDIRGMYRRILMELCANRFQWDGLPDTVDVRYLELTLLRKGHALFYNDAVVGYIAVPAVAVGQTNVVDEPVAYRTIGRGVYRSQLVRPRVVRDGVVRTEGVPIWSNYMRVPDLDIIEIFSQRLAQSDRSIEIATMNLRRTRVLIGSQGQRLSLENVSRQIDEGQQTIGVGTNFDVEGIQEFNLGGDPRILEAMQVSHTREWNKCMGLLGINNANQDKKERLVADEVAANDEQVTAMKAVNLNERQKAAREISRMIGSDVTVNFRADAESMANAYRAQIMEGITNGNFDTEN